MVISETTISVRLPRALYEQVRESAARECRSVSGQIRWLLMRGLEEQQQKPAPDADK